MQFGKESGMMDREEEKVQQTTRNFCKYRRSYYLATILLCLFVVILIVVIFAVKGSKSKGIRPLSGKPVAKASPIPLATAPAKTSLQNILQDLE